tara:strand:+ start:148 stop:672 length:525 start_codon:yes stop_codon:yes gene_type:complete
MESFHLMESQEPMHEHPLYDKWVLWAHLPHDTDWSLSSYSKILELSTIEQVISLYNSIPALMVRNCMLFLMRRGINPTWEDEKNSNGGCFSFKVSNKAVPAVWKELSYLLTGETVSIDRDFQKNITGITISPKKSFCILKIWMCDLNYQNPKNIARIKGLPIQGCLFKKHKPSF